MDMRLLGGSHLLRALGFNPGGFFDHLEEFHARQFDMLSNLQDSFGTCSGNMGANALAQMLQGGGIAPSGCAQQPDASCCRCPGQYSEPQSFDFGATPGGSNPFSFEALSNRMQGMQFERFLQNNPFARQQVEMMLGGRIIPDGVADGRVQVQRFPGGGGQGGSPSAQNAMGFLDQIMRAGMASGLPMPQMFQGMMMAALTNLLQGGAGGAGGANGIRSQGGGSPFVDWADSPQARRNQQIAGGGGGGGVGGPHQATQGGPNQGAFGIGNGDDGDASSVLNDSSLTVEDKVTLMIMMIMKKMDKDIEKQANYINKLQQQQQGGGGGKGGKGGGGGGGNPSIDVETMKLKRLIDKRSQMFDMLRQIIDKYNETAKNIIQSMGR